MPDNTRNNSENSEDGSSSLDPIPSSPPGDEHGRFNMGSRKEMHKQAGRYVGAVPNGHSGDSSAASASATQQIRDSSALIDQTGEPSDPSSSFTPKDSQLPPRAPQHHEATTTQPSTSGKTYEMSITSEDSRANTPSGIMKEMSLKENDQSSQYTTGSSMAGNMASATKSQTRVDRMNPISNGTVAAGVGAILSEYNSQQAQQRQRPEELTTYYSMASQCSLPIHTPTAVAAENERLRKLSKEFLKGPVHTFEKLSFILGRGRLVMVRVTGWTLRYRVIYCSVSHPCSFRLH